MNFHVAWHRRPERTETGPEWHGASVSVPSIRLSMTDLSLPWSVSFDDACAALELLERMFVEPDGSFVWRPSPKYQVDGQIYDRNGSLVYLTLIGNCIPHDLMRIHQAVNPQPHPLIVQLVREGVMLNWEDWITSLR